MLKAALTPFGDKDTFFRTGIAGKFDDINQGRLIIFFLDHAGFDAL